MRSLISVEYLALFAAIRSPMARLYGRVAGLVVDPSSTPTYPFDQVCLQNYFCRAHTPDPRVIASWPQAFQTNPQALEAGYALAYSVLCPNPVRSSEFLFFLLPMTNSLFSIRFQPRNRLERWKRYKLQLPPFRPALRRALDPR